ncbi:cupin domain-containing protein [Flavobacterium sp. J372]|uniref:cupin domain-containing protein n=1 Tax=Flavobacterium sp. J372 TaxID=2898436 RepID=UPI002151C07C|nr:cupin domain-containing protein [Flavobacterium sp. J372]MCR5862072.1 cupin domain-containing protein [Flavobacterium sp. J372]
MFFNSDCGWQEIDENVQRQITGFNAGLMMVNVLFKKGGIGPLHSHPHTQATYIAKGVFEVTIGGETKTLGAGDSFFVMPNMVHCVVCHEDGMLVDVFNPVREDFIK